MKRNKKEQKKKNAPLLLVSFFPSRQLELLLLSGALSSLPLLSRYCTESTTMPRDRLPNKPTKEDGAPDQGTGGRVKEPV